MLLLPIAALFSEMSLEEQNRKRILVAQGSLKAYLKHFD